MVCSCKKDRLLYRWCSHHKGKHSLHQRYLKYWILLSLLHERGNCIMMLLQRNYSCCVLTVGFFSCIFFLKLFPCLGEQLSPG
ncbi:hypothetical protein Nmel_002625, partial [Mimus melanotis]